MQRRRRPCYRRPPARRRSRGERDQGESPQLRLWARRGALARAPRGASRPHDCAAPAAEDSRAPRMRALARRALPASAPAPVTARPLALRPHIERERAQPQLQAHKARRIAQPSAPSARHANAPESSYTVCSSAVCSVSVVSNEERLWNLSCNSATVQRASACNNSGCSTRMLVGRSPAAPLPPPWLRTRGRVR